MEDEGVIERREVDVLMLDILTLFRVIEAVETLTREAEMLTLVSFGRMSMFDREREPPPFVTEKRGEERVEVM